MFAARKHTANRDPKSGKRSPERARTTVQPVRAVQRASCTCGGGCPRCQQQVPPQAKLQVSQPGDTLELEADRVADEVLYMPQPKAPVNQGARQRSTLRLSRSAAGPPTRNAAEVPTIVQRVMRSRGEPLDPPTRTFMEPRFAYDFSSVRVHSGAAAQQSARDLRAMAYTVGCDIVFGTGRFAPGTSEGRRLIAHELAHVVQQSGAQSSVRIARQPIDAGRPFEEDRMLNCMEETDRLAPARLAKSSFEICKDKYDYDGPELVVTEDDKRQILFGEIVSSEDLKDFADALGEYHQWVEQGLVSFVDREEIERQIDVAMTLLRTHTGVAMSQGTAEQSGTSGAIAIGGLRAVTAATAAESTVATATVGERVALRWGVGRALVPAAVEAASVAEGATAAVSVGESSAAAASVAPAVLTVAAVALAAYLAYRLWRWIETEPDPVRTHPEVPRAIRDVTRRIRFQPEKMARTRSEPRGLPWPLPDLSPEPDRGRRRRKKKIYPICWPELLPPLLPTRLVPHLPLFLRRTRSPDRDYAGTNQTALQKTYERKHKGDFSWGSMHVHHVIPLFLGGPDDLVGNGFLLERRIHLRGHDWLRHQPQLKSFRISTDLYDHSVGRWYYVAGYKEKRDDRCGDPQVMELSEESVEANKALAPMTTHLGQPTETGA